MFTTLEVKKGVKDTIALLVVCCLLFGSLTLGSVTLSSCSPKNNPASRDQTTATAKNEMVEDLKKNKGTEDAKKKNDDKNTEDEKGKLKIDDGQILLDNTSKGAPWYGIAIVANIAAFVVDSTVSALNKKIVKEYLPAGKLQEIGGESKLVLGNLAGALAGGVLNKFMGGDFMSGFAKGSALAFSCFVISRGIRSVQAPVIPVSSGSVPPASSVSAASEGGSGESSSVSAVVNKGESQKETSKSFICSVSTLGSVVELFKYFIGLETFLVFLSRFS